MAKTGITRPFTRRDFLSTSLKAGTAAFHHRFVAKS